jgi:hypothetical protein
MSSVVISGDTSGAITVSAPAVAGTNTLTLQAATATSAINTLGTALAYNWNGLTTNTSLDFTGLPSWIKRITVMFGGVSTNSTSNLLVQLGYQNPVTSTGYVSTCAYNGAGTLQSANSTAGFVIVTQNASQTVYGQLIISLIGSNIWVASGNVTNSTTASAMLSGGVTLSGTLDRVRITSVTPDTFDAGSVNILYEG